MEDLKLTTASNYIGSAVVVADFWNSTSIAPTNTAKAIMEFLALPQSVNSMIEATKMGLPALSGVVIPLEENFADTPDFPLHQNGQGANATYRRNIGWMVRHVMSYYGYTPMRQGGIITRIPVKEGGVRKSYFTTAAVYKPVGEKRFEIECFIKAV